MAGLDFVSDLKLFKSVWKIRVKVIRLWKQYSCASGETMEMVLADSRGDMIHGTVKKEMVSQYEHIKCVAVGEVALFLHNYWNSTNVPVVLCVLQFWKLIGVLVTYSGFKHMATIDGFSRILFEPDDVPEIQSFRMR
ncbi:hypothetical protein HID58_012175 [Brassica napus]|uniref:Replication protein A 70 kDa DNA-binding subunit B/D first OB fold domain-containing protein n=1 Tax=Brassica napus TaxID=3708 RepID=A0ABQ8E0T1_BRANA|nr:hypothetical protein HID58_012175 [Brassica napus]